MGDQRQTSDIAGAAGTIVGATAGFAMGGPGGALMGANMGKSISKQVAPPPTDPYGQQDSISILDLLNTITGVQGGIGDGGLKEAGRTGGSAFGDISQYIAGNGNIMNPTFGRSGNYSGFKVAGNINSPTLGYMMPGGNAGMRNVASASRRK